MKSHELLQGNYTWDMQKHRSFGHERVTMIVMKGKKQVGMIIWHPGAKCLCYDGKYWNTPELIDFVRPWLEKKKFYMAWKICKLLDKQEKCDKCNN